MYIRTHDAKTIPFRLRRGIMNMRTIRILHLRHRCEPLTLISKGSLTHITTLRLLHKSLQICFRRQLYGCRKADEKRVSSKCFQCFKSNFRSKGMFSQSNACGKSLCRPKMKKPVGGESQPCDRTGTSLFSHFVDIFTHSSNNDQGFNCFSRGEGVVPAF